MKTVEIALPTRGYQVRIGAGLLSQRDEFAPWIEARRVCIVTDETVAKLYLDRLRDALRDFEPLIATLPTGESHKNLRTLESVIDLLMQHHCDRQTTVIALGGGVVGDIAGFAAACYQRGVNYIQAPTTLLAQVDSSVGGKTGVNHPRGKNMIGAFYQPRRVLADTDCLASLDARQFSAGLAEVIKYGVIGDRDFFAWLETNMQSVIARNNDALEHIIAASCINKARIVERDERESGARALLNLGHTFAHAIETAGDYRRWLHGEAVGIGIAMAARMATQLGALHIDDCARIERLLTAAGLSIAPFDGVDAHMLLTLMQSDKKVRDGKVRLVLPCAIGEAILTDDYPPQALADVVAAFTNGA